MRKEDNIIKRKYKKPVRPANWNTPDDSLWEAIATEVGIDERDDERGGVLWPLTALFSVIIITVGLPIGYLVMPDSTDNATATQIDAKASDEKTTVNEEVFNITETEINLKGVDQIEVLKSDELVSSGEKNFERSSQNDNVVAVTETSATIKSNPFNSAGIKKTSLTENSGNSADLNKMGNTSEQTTSAALQNIAQLGAKNIQPAEVEEINKRTLVNVTALGHNHGLYIAPITLNPLNGISAIMPRTDVQSENRLSVQLTSGAIYWMNNPNQALQTALEPAGFFENSAWGWQTQLSLSVPLTNRWSLQTGLGYSSVEFSSGHNSELNYTVENEIVKGKNDIDLTIATPLGFVNSQIGLTRDDAWDSDASFLADIITNQRIQSIQVPVSLAYTLPINNKWSITPSAGISALILTDVQSGVANVATHHNHIHYVSSMLNQEIQYLNTMSLDIQVGLGISRHLTRNIQLGVSGNYTHGMTPIFSNNEFRTSRSVINIQTGISYSF